MGLFSFFKRKENSKDIAKERLKMVLVQDRANVSDTMIEEIKEEILKAVSKFIEVDKTGFDVKMTRMKTDRNTTISALQATLPIERIKESKA